MDVAGLEALLERQAIVDTVVRYAWALDAKDWDMARACFADQVEADYADLRGGVSERMPAEEFVARRREALARLKTHHLSTNHLVTLAGDSATCVSAMLIHRLDPEAEPASGFDTLGHYVHTLARTPEGWKITSVKQSVAWNRGNPSIHAGARPPGQSPGAP